MGHDLPRVLPTREGDSQTVSIVKTFLAARDRLTLLPPRPCTETRSACAMEMLSADTRRRLESTARARTAPLRGASGSSCVPRGSSDRGEPGARKRPSEASARSPHRSRWSILQSFHHPLASIMRRARESASLSPCARARVNNARRSLKANRAADTLTAEALRAHVAKPHSGERGGVTSSVTCVPLHRLCAAFPGTSNSLAPAEHDVPPFLAASADRTRGDHEGDHERDLRHEDGHRRVGRHRGRRAALPSRANEAVRIHRQSQ